MTCALDAAARDDRRAWFRERLLPSALTGARTDAGLQVVFDLESAVRDDLRTFIGLERQCCGFLDFELTEVDDTLVLEITGPEGANAVLDQMAADLVRSPGHPRRGRGGSQ